MRKFLLIGTGLALVAGTGVAFAQMPPGGPGGPESGNMDGQRPPMMHRFEEMHHHRDFGGAAAFRFKKGDSEIDVKCSNDEPTFVCVRAASVLLDKLNSSNAGMGSPGNPTSGPAAPNGATPPPKQP